jgi:hypothetical protein
MVRVYSLIPGTLRLSVQHNTGWTFPRDVLESVPEGPLPARAGFLAVPGGVADVDVIRNLHTHKLSKNHT